jgi:hypothetical protein
MVYIEKKMLIDSLHPMGMSYPAAIMINLDGINAVDNIMSQSLEALKNEGWVVTNW